jgi:hypothetical protein
MKARITINIETRNEQQGCSWRCPYLKIQRGVVLTVEHYCLLFGELHYIPGQNCARRNPKCVRQQTPFDENKPQRPKRVVKSNAPTAWDRLSKGGPVP